MGGHDQRSARPIGEQPVTALQPDRIGALAEVDRGEWTFSAATLNGYLHHGVDPGYRSHSRISELWLQGYLTYDPAGSPVTLTDQGRAELARALR